MASSSLRYGFGKNWDEYLRRHFSDERVAIAKSHLLEFLRLDSLDGKSFLDIGCGSGIHSLAALRAGALRIDSFDYDPDAVAASRRLREYEGNPERWTVRQGSILDAAFVGGLAPADIVYSWGVLHHTGDMWTALDNAAKLIKEGGVFYAALYDYDIQVNPPAEFWLDVKQKYNRAGRGGRKRLEWWYIWRFVLHRNIFGLPGLMKKIRGYKQSRGMAFFTDIKDWLGGWPMAFAKRADVAAWATRTGLEMAVMKTGEANTEYLFRKGPGGKN
jgi:SAM-dependent methyltransferase